MSCMFVLHQLGIRQALLSHRCFDLSFKWFDSIYQFVPNDVISLFSFSFHLCLTPPLTSQCLGFLGDPSEKVPAKDPSFRSLVVYELNK